MKVSPARTAAFDILLKIELKNAYSAIILPIYEANLNPKDSSLCHELVLGTLRRKLLLDEYIKKLTNKKINKFDIEVLIALRIGIFQLLFLDRIPVYSSINESVNLVKRAKKKSASGLVNAVLRKISKAKTEIQFRDNIHRLSIQTSHPIWLIERWIKAFGLEEAKKIAEENNSIPSLSFRFTNKFYSLDKHKQNEIVESFKNNSKRSELISDCFTANKFTVNLFSLANEGMIYFQDVGSQIVADIVGVKEPESFLDLCASPGSKTTFVAKDFNLNGQKQQFVAGDYHSHRMRNLKKNCNNQGINFIDFVQYDAQRSLPFKRESFDAVLVDAPCTGTGTIRHNPEIRYQLKENDILDLSSKQLEILKQASKVIKNGGRLIYSTCSLEVEENESIIKTFLGSNKDYKVIKSDKYNRFLTPDNFFRTFPHKDNIDGFFVAILEKV